VNAFELGHLLAINAGAAAPTKHMAYQRLDDRTLLTLALPTVRGPALAPKPGYEGVEAPGCTLHPVRGGVLRLSQRHKVDPLTYSVSPSEGMSSMHARLPLACALAAAWLMAGPAQAAPAFVNGLTIDANTLDASGGTVVNDGRLGFFSDIYYDPRRNEWWALSDRGPGGGTLQYETRVHRFKLDVNQATGEISNFQVLKTLIFRKGGSEFNGFAPAIAGPLGLAFDPEGIVVNPRNGHLLVSDEYGPSLYEFNRSGRKVRAYEIPANLSPRNAATGVVNYANDTGADPASAADDNTAGKRTNRGFEGLAISPDGRYAFAMLQSAMLDEGGGSGTLNRIVKFDTRAGRAVAQYAYRMEGSGQGRGISALVAINDTEFLVLERNNRGLGVPDANVESPNKKVFRINLAGATDVSGIDLDAAGAVFTTVSKSNTTPWLDLAASATLSDPSLATLGGVSPEKWEGLAIGPRLMDGSYLVLAGTDNDYSVTQNGTGTQFDVYFKPNALLPSLPSRIQCDIGTFANCRTISTGGAVVAPVGDDFDFSGYRLIPGVLHAYRASAADLVGLKRPGKDRKDDDRDFRPDKYGD
jgi:hypothetical protein